MREKKKSILDRVRLVVSWNELPSVIKVDRLGRSIHYKTCQEYLIE